MAAAGYIPPEQTRFSLQIRVDCGQLARPAWLLNEFGCSASVFVEQLKQQSSTPREADIHPTVHRRQKQEHTGARGVACSPPVALRHAHLQDWTRAALLDRVQTAHTCGTETARGLEYGPVLVLLLPNVRTDETYVEVSVKGLYVSGATQAVCRSNKKCSQRGHP